MALDDLVLLYQFFIKTCTKQIWNWFFHLTIHSYCALCYNWIKNERRMQCEDKTKGLKVIFESRNNQSKILLSFSEAMFNFWIRLRNLNFNTILGINSDVVLVFFDAQFLLSSTWAWLPNFLIWSNKFLSSSWITKNKRHYIIPDPRIHESYSIPSVWLLIYYNHLFAFCFTRSWRQWQSDY